MEWLLSTANKCSRCYKIPMNLHPVTMTSRAGHPRGRAAGRVRGAARRALLLSCCCGGTAIASGAPADAPVERDTGATEAADVELAEYVITGTRTLHRVDESPVRTEIITADELERGGARTLADSVELLSGARVENNCQNCGTSEVLLLGLEGQYTSLLFDGVPLFSGLAGVYGLDQVPSAFIDRLEVVKGGGSAIYGSGAVGGVVNIIGRRPDATGAMLEYRHDLVKGQATRQWTALADHVTADRSRAITLYAQTVRAEPVDLNADGFSDLTKRALDVYGARVIQRLGEGEVRLDYTHTAEFRRGGNKFELPDPLADISERIDTARDAATLSWQAIVSPNVDAMVSASYAVIDRETFYGGLFGHAPDEPLSPETAPGAGDNDQAYLDRGYKTHGEVARDQFGFTDNHVVNLEAQANVRWAEHHTSVGLQYYRESIEDLVPVSSFVADYPAARERARGDTVGAFVQDDWHLGTDWELVTGLRVDRNSELDHVVLSPRVNVMWVADETLTLRAAVGTGFRAPQPFDEDLHIELIAGERAVTRQADDLREERSTSALLSATWNPAFADGRVSFEAGGFLTRLDGAFAVSAVSTEPETGVAYRTRYNGPDAEIGGVEVNIGALPWPDVRLDLGYMAQVARYEEPVVLFEEGDTVVRARDFMETPRHYAVAQATYSPRDIGVVSLSATYTGSMQDINLRTGRLNRRTDSFLVWNATASKRFALNRDGLAVTLTLGVKNLFDARQRDLETGVDRDPYYLYGPRTPRTVFMSMRVEL